MGENAIYYAHWNIVEYDISYALNGHGSLSSTAPSKYNVTQSVNIPKANPEFGYAFTGWTGSNGSTPQLEVSIPIGTTGNKTYIANWSIGTYTVHFNSNHGYGTMEDQVFRFNEYQRLRENAYNNRITVEFNGMGGTPSRNESVSYLEFLGWSKEENGSVAYSNNANVINITDGSSITLYAKWGEASKIYMPNAIRTGYTFDKWYTASSDEIGGVNAPYTPTADITLYAHWTANTYTVTLDPTLGEVSQTSITVTFDQPYGNLPVPTSDEYAFIGWFTKAYGGDQVLNTTKATVAGNHTLYAHWKDGKMTLTFNPAEGDLPDDVPETRRCRIGQPFGELPVPTRRGYIFIGWYSEKISQEEITANTIAPDHDMTIYAEWLPISYTVRFDANGGSGQMEDQVMTYGIGSSLNSNQFHQSGSVFLGWSTGPEGNVLWEDEGYVNNLSTTLNDVVVLYAIWTTDPIDVTFHSSWDQFVMTFDANGGEGGWRRKLNVNDTITPPTVTRLHHTFSRWNPTPPVEMPSNDLTCIAQWQQLPLFADITTDNAKATCSNVNPATGTTVSYSTSSQTSGYQNGNQFTLSFTTLSPQTKNGWFKLSNSNLGTAIYKVSITRTTEKDWSNWSSPSGPWSASAIAAWRVRLENRYGEGNYETRATQNSPGLYVQERHSTSYSTSYSSTVAKVQ